MAAPSLVGSVYTVGFTGVEVVELTLVDGLASGNAVGIILQQIGALERAVTGLSDTVNNYAGDSRVNAGITGVFVRIFAKVAVGVLSPGGILTLTLDGIAEGRLTAFEITPATLSGLTDTFTRAIGGTSNQCGTLGLTTSGDVFVIGAAATDGDHGGATPSDGYSTLRTPSDETAEFYKASDTALTSTTVPWTSTNSRPTAGCMTAFYSSGAAETHSRILPSNKLRPRPFAPGWAR